MNYLTFIMVIALGFGLLDCVAAPYPKLQRDLYHLELVVMIFLFVIRYYYGPDINSYVPHYESLGNPTWVLGHLDEVQFESGYNILCSVIKWLGGSYWVLTAVITLLYFSAIVVLFQGLTRYRALGLSVLILLDYSLIAVQNRQALAVVCFIYMVLLMQHRKYLWAIVLAVCCALMHKTGIAVVAVIWTYWFFKDIAFRPYVYEVLAVILLILMVIPVSNISQMVVDALPLSESLTKSIEHHLSLGRQIQLVAIIYLLLLVTVSYFMRYVHHTRRNMILFTMFIGVIVLVVFYQYYFLLNRIRSYFLPIIISWLIDVVIEARQTRRVPYSQLVVQTLMVVVFLYLGHNIYTFQRETTRLHAPIYKTSTIFDLTKHSSSEIKERQLRIANRYWELDYMRDDTNKLK